MHDARVLAGQSGGALVRETDGKLLGVHSFGDAFWGGSRDVCVLVNAATLDAIEIARDGVDPEVLRDGAGERDDFSFERRGAEAHGARVVGEAARVVDLLIGRVDRSM